MFILLSFLGTIGVQEGSALDLVPNAGNVFSFFQRNINIKLRGLTFPNGIAFSSDKHCMYLAESDLRVIYVFDYDIRKGDISEYHHYPLQSIMGSEFDLPYVF